MNFMISTQKTCRFAHSSSNVNNDNMHHHTILDLFWRQVEAQPNRPAVAQDDLHLTYSELAELVYDIAVYLQFLSVIPDEAVGLYVEPSIDLMAGVWGVLTAGAAYLPLSPEYPEERLQYMIKDCGARVIFTQEKLKERCRDFAPQNAIIITLNDVMQHKKNVGTRPLTPIERVSTNQLAYIIYTSGTTGKPKGVMIEHHSIANQMHWLKNKMAINEKTVILQKTPISFDAAQWEVLALSCGSQVVMASVGEYRNPPQLIKRIRSQHINTLQCVPTLLQALIDNDNFKHCKSLSHVYSGGEALHRQLAKQFIDMMPNCRLVNLYGPTECTINSSAYVYDPKEMDNESNTISIGHPINNIQYFLLDEAMKPVAQGKPGELYIAGEGLARGYVNQPEMTAIKFVNHPDRTTLRLYKSGDIVSLNKDGSFQYIARTDNQIKVGGYRIEIDEITTSIYAHDWVKNAAVIVKKDSNTGYQNLIAFVEMNAKEAALMDQGNHDAHHQSKQSKAQVKLQLSNSGCRHYEHLSKQRVVNLAGKLASEAQNKKVFARKTYRFYNGRAIVKQDILDLLNTKVETSRHLDLAMLNVTVLGEILRYFGQFTSESRLLPKYGYASPGALYATQMYLEINNMFDLESGYYYYHPVHHQLYLISRNKPTHKPHLKLHFIGKKCAIEPIYKNNILEVLEMEVGHMVGLFENILPEYGLNIQASDYVCSIKEKLDVANEDYYLGRVIN